MSSSSLSAAATEAWSEACRSFGAIDNARMEQDEMLSEARDLHTDLHATSSADQERWEHVRNLYREALKLAKVELTYYQSYAAASALELTLSLGANRNYEDAGRALKSIIAEAESKAAAAAASAREASAAAKNSKKRKSEHSHSSSSAPSRKQQTHLQQYGVSVPDTLAARIPITVGVQVAARTIEDLQVAWIWGTVTRVIADTREFEVEDADDKRKMRKGIREVIPLRPAALPEYTAGTVVLACYPGTTAFYKATVIAPPSASSAPGHYEVTFEDDQGKRQLVDLIAEYDVRKVEDGQSQTAAL
ncbi:hypothetical protein RI367_001098 [Sorochytrium milnesiophthora]